MLKFLRMSVATVVLSAFVAAPVVTLVSAGAAYAKSDNSNGGGGNGGKGGDGGKGGNGNGGAKSDAGKGKGNGGKSAKSGNGASGKSQKGTFKSDMRTLGAKVKSGFGLFGKGKKETAKATAKQAAPAKRTVKAAAAAPKVRGPLHPSNLGKLNGAINSSPNAKLAHIANGNFNGPVGLAAALALADYTYGVQVDAYAAATETAALAEAFDLIENAPTAQDIIDAQELIDNGIDDGQADIDAQATLDYPDTAEAEALTDGKADPTEAELAEAQATLDAGEPTLADVTAAEDAVLDAYKGTLDDASKAEVLGAVRGSLPTAEEIADTLPQEETVEPAPVEVDEAMLDLKAEL